MFSALGKFSVKTNSKFLHVVCDIYTVPGTALSTSCILTDPVLTVTYNPHSTDEKVEAQGVKSITPGFLDGKWQSWDPGSGSLAQEAAQNHHATVFLEGKGSAKETERWMSICPVWSFLYASSLGATY